MIPRSITPRTASWWRVRSQLAELSVATGLPVPALEIKKPRPVSRLFSNSLAMGAANVVGRGLGYIYIVMMARRLDARYLGAYAVLVTASMLVELVSNLGLDKILVREITKGSANLGQGYFWAALPIRFAMAAMSALVAWTLLFVLFKNQLLATPLSCAVFLSAIFPVIATRNCEAFLTAHERMLPIAVAQFCEKVVVFGAVLLLVSGSLSFSGLLCFAPLAALLRFLVVAPCVVRMWVPHLTPVRADVRRLLRQGAELFSVEILALVYFRSDVFIVARKGGLAAAGVYQITYKIFDFCLSLFAGYLQAAFPRMVRDKSRKSLKMTLAMGTGLMMIPVAVIIHGRHLILSTLRPEYVLGSTSLVWLMLTVPLVFITSTFANMAIAAGRIKILILVAGLLIASNVGLNLLLIPKWSIDGAAFSTFACELLSAVVLGPFVLKMIARPENSQ
jgi:O-antigen/teichoic acid export membrane protein